METECFRECSEFYLYSLNKSNLKGFGQRIAAIEGVMFVKWTYKHESFDSNLIETQVTE